MKRLLSLLVGLTLMGSLSLKAQCPGSQPFGLGPDTTVCSNGVLSLTPGPFFFSYLWNDGSTDEFLVVADSGTYFVQAFDSNGCDYYDTIFVGLSFPTPAVITPGDSDIVCNGDSAYFAFSNAGSFYSYLWSDGITTSDNYFNAPGLYYAIGINSSGCADTVNITVWPAPSPPLNLTTPVYFCRGDSLLINAADPGFVSYDWSHGPGTAAAYISDAGIYGLEVIDTNGCHLIDTLTAFFYTAPVVTIWPGGVYCNDTTLTLDAGPGWASQSWSNGATTQSILVTSSGNYFVLVTDANGCRDTSNIASITINGSPPVTDITYSNHQLHAETDATYSYQWYENGVLVPGATTEHFDNPVENSTYSCLITNPAGCNTMSNAYLFTGDLDDTPEGFSPNNDGINDVFAIPGLPPYPDNRLVIYNRYGSEIFVAKPYGNNWDGTGPSGEPLPDGTYFYVLDLGTNIAPRSGFIMINR